MSIPTLPLLNLSEQEASQIAELERLLLDQLPWLDLSDAYYNGTQVMTSLGISIPPELDGLHVTLGWPALPPDSIDERTDVVGFRYPDETEPDNELLDIWKANNLAEEGPLAHLDAMIFGRSYLAAGSNPDGGQPLITPESPKNMVVSWDPQRRSITAALRLYEFEGESSSTLYLPNETIYLSRNYHGLWQIDERDRHNLGVVPVARMANRQRTSERNGKSEITPTIMAITDAACRKLLGVEVASEFFAVPQRYVLGATEKAFQDAKGNPKSAWETYIGRVLALERDENDNMPQVGTFDAYNPEAFVKVFDMYGEILATNTGLPASYFGKSTANPASADAIRMQTDRLVQRVKRRQSSFAGAWEQAMRLALLVRDGSIPDNAHMLETIWRNPEIPTPGATTDAVAKQIDSGYLPPDSDVVGEVLGYTPLQQQRIAKDRRRYQARQSLTAVFQKAQQPQQPEVSSGGPAPAVSG